MFTLLLHGLEVGYIGVGCGIRFHVFIIIKPLFDEVSDITIDSTVSVRPLWNIVKPRVTRITDYTSFDTAMWGPRFSCKQTAYYFMATYRLHDLNDCTVFYYLYIFHDRFISSFLHSRWMDTDVFVICVYQEQVL